MLCLVAAVLLSLSAHGRASEEALDYFVGRTITYLVPGKPGGGYDTYARLITRYMAEQMPGTRFVVKNTPGAGGLLAVHQLYAAKPDGLTLASVNTGLIYAQLVDSDALRFKLRELNWIGKSASDARVLVIGKMSPFRSVADLQRHDQPALLGASGVGSASYNETLLIRGLLGLNVRIIPGFRGENSELAIMRGDIDGRLHSYSSVRSFVEKGEASIILQLSGSAPLGNGIPLARDLVNESDSATVFDVMDAVVDLGRLTAAPPGVSAERLGALRAAYARALSDPALLQEAASLHLSIAPADGGSVSVRLDQILGQAERDKQAIKALLTIPPD